jgi:hypothetical protein
MRKYLHSLLFVVLTGAAINAHALCMNPDGSLDDASVPLGTISTDVLPTCQDQEKKATEEKSGGKQNNTES